MKSPPREKSRGGGEPASRSRPRGEWRQSPEKVGFPLSRPTFNRWKNVVFRSLDRQNLHDAMCESFSAFRYFFSFFLSFFLIVPPLHICTHLHLNQGVMTKHDLNNPSTRSDKIKQRKTKKWGEKNSLLHLHWFWFCFFFVEVAFFFLLHFASKAQSNTNPTISQISTNHSSTWLTRRYSFVVDVSFWILPKLLSGKAPSTNSFSVEMDSICI